MTCNAIGQLSINVLAAGAPEGDRMVVTFPTSIPIGGCISGEQIHPNFAIASVAMKCTDATPEGVDFEAFMGNECAGDPLPRALVNNMAEIGYTVSDVQCGGVECPFATVSGTEGCSGNVPEALKNIEFYFTDVCAADTFKRECANDVITTTPCAGGASTTTASGCNDVNGVDYAQTVKCIPVNVAETTAAPGPQPSDDDKSSTRTFRGLLTVTLMALSIAAIAMI